MLVLMEIRGRVWQCVMALCLLAFEPVLRWAKSPVCSCLPSVIEEDSTPLLRHRHKRQERKAQCKGKPSQRE